MKALKAIAILFTLAMFIVIGIGLMIDDSRFQTVEGSLIVFMSVFFGYCIWKRPALVISPLIDDAFDNMPPTLRVDSISTEHKLHIKIKPKTEGFDSF